MIPILQIPLGVHYTFLRVPYTFCGYTLHFVCILCILGGCTFTLGGALCILYIYSAFLEGALSLLGVHFVFLGFTYHFG